MPEEKSETAVAPESAEAAPESAAGKSKSKRAAEKGRRSHGDRAMASLRAAKRGQREVSEPTERAQFLLAEANVLALLDVADALGGSSTSAEE